jgi:CBS domain containing-hemolysin-like protein
MMLAMMAILAINGIFVAAEFALVAMRHSRIQELLDEGHPQARLLKKLKDNIDLSVSGIQLGITLASIALGWIGEHSILELVKNVLGNIPGVAGWQPPPGIGVALSFLVLAMLHAVLGEQVPKLLALRMPERMILLLARPYDIYSRLMHPLIWSMDKMTLACLWLVGIRDSNLQDPVHSAEELEILIDHSRKAGELGDRETDLLKRVLDLRDLTVEQVMVPVQDMDTLAVNSTLPVVLKLVTKKKHSKIPVFEGTVDNVVGVLNTPDLFDWFLIGVKAGREGMKEFNLRKMIRPAYQALTTDKASVLLDELRRRRVQIAIVKDASGKTVGLCTLEDLLEQLVGEIEDEYGH